METQAQEQTETAAPVQKKASEYKFFALCSLAGKPETVVLEGATKAQLRKVISETPELLKINRLFRGREVSFQAKQTISL